MTIIYYSQCRSSSLVNFVKKNLYITSCTYTLSKLLISILVFQVFINYILQQDEFRNKKKNRLIPTNLYSRAYSSSYSCSDLLDNASLNAVANDSHVYNNAQWPEFQNVVQKHTMADVSIRDIITEKC